MKNPLMSLKNLMLKNNDAIPYLGQGLATFGIKLPLSTMTTNLGHKIITGVSGLAINVLNEWKNMPGKSKDFLRQFGCSLMFEPFGNMQNSMEMGRNWEDIKSMISRRNYAAGFGAMFDTRSDIIASIRKLLGFNISNPFSRFFKSGVSTNEIRKVTEDIVSGYGKEATYIEPKSMITY